MSSIETIDVLYNASYGEFGLSLEALDLYNTRNKLIDEDFVNVYEYGGILGWMDRHEQILVDIYKELGEKAFGSKNCNIKIKKIPKIYKRFYEITEYDGKEWIRIDSIGYEEEIEKNKIKAVLGDKNKTDSEKIIELKKLIFGDD